MADLTYEVSFKGVASPTLRAAFIDCELRTGVGSTWARCTHDALREIIARIEDLGLELLDVRLIAELPAEDHPPVERTEVERGSPRPESDINAAPAAAPDPTGGMSP